VSQSENATKSTSVADRSLEVGFGLVTGMALVLPHNEVGDGE
jgi:hypothetical protein